MRVVMLTDNARIDRRILLEANALSGEGHEVILLAAESPEHPPHHFEGPIKIERVGTPLAAPSRRAIRYAVNSYLSSCEHAATKAELWSERAQTQTQRPTRGILRESRGGAVRALRVALPLQEKAVRRAARLLYRIDIKLRQLDDRDHHLAERVCFYRPDVIHAHDLPQLRPAAAAKRALGVPLVYDAHELYPEIHTLSAREKEVLARREARHIRSCDLVITVNRYIAQIMAERYRIREPAVILNAEAAPPGFERERYDRFRASLPIPRDAMILLYQGWMPPEQRGLQALVRSMALVRNPRIHLVLMGYGERREVFASLVRELGIGDRVHLKEAVPQSELLFWTASADAGIIPYPPVDLNSRFCSPNKLYEFITARLPILANDLPYLREVVAGNGFGLVRWLETPADFAAAIDAMFENFPAGFERFRDSMSRAGERFDWAVQAEKLLSLYRPFVAAERGTSGIGERSAHPSRARREAFTG